MTLIWDSSLSADHTVLETMGMEALNSPELSGLGLSPTPARLHLC